MTNEEAYIAGFCKAAEAAGVDPEQLMKSAMPLRAVLMGMNKGRAGLQRAFKSLSNVGMRSKNEHKILDRLSRDLGITPGTYNSLARANDQFRAYGDYVNKNPSVFNTLTNKGRARLQRALKPLSNVGMRSKKEHKILNRLSSDLGITPGTQRLERANDQFRAYGDYVNKNPSVFNTLKGSPTNVGMRSKNEHKILNRLSSDLGITPGTDNSLARANDQVRAYLERVNDQFSAHGDYVNKNPSVFNTLTNKGRARLQRALKPLSNVGMRSKKEHKILNRLSSDLGITPGTQRLERANDQFRAYGDYVNKNPSVFDTLKGSPTNVGMRSKNEHKILNRLSSDLGITPGTDNSLARANDQVRAYLERVNDQFRAHGDYKPHNIGNWMNPRMVYDRLFR